MSIMGIFDGLMDADPRRDALIGEDEWGRAIRKSILGHRYVEGPAPKPAMTMADFWQRSADMRQPPRDPTTPLDALRALVGGVLEGFTVPGKALRGEPVTLGDVWNTAGTAALGAQAVPAPQGAFRMFAGRNAKTADLDAMARAQAMLDAGNPRDAVWQETGWMRGVDGKMRFEIDDSGASIDPNAIKYANGRNLEEAFWHPQAYAAHDFPHRLSAGIEPQQRGSMGAPEYRVRKDGGSLAATAKTPGAYMDRPGDILARAPSKDEVERTVLHEMQHYLQTVEGFAEGDNVSRAAAEVAAKREAAVFADATALIQSAEGRAARVRLDELAATWRGRSDVPAEVANEVTALRALPEIKAYEAKGAEISAMRKQAGGGRGALESGLVDRSEAYALYRSAAGEVEARNVEARRAMTAAERRANPPWMTQDVQDEMQIVRGILPVQPQPTGLLRGAQ